MKKLLLLVCMLATAALGQNTQTISASGGSLQFLNASGSGTLTFEYTFSGSASSVSITVQGCMQGGTCSTLTALTGSNPYTSGSNGIVSFTGGYNYYTVTASYSGTATVTVSLNSIQAKLGSGSGSGTVAAGTGVAYYNLAGGTTINGANLTGFVYGNGASAPTAATQGQLFSLIGYTPAPGASLPGTPNLVYNMLAQTSGSTVNDTSGNAYNCTLGGTTVPTWSSSGGLYFPSNGNCSMPAAVNSNRTWAFAFYKDTLTTTGLPQNSYPMLVSSSLGNSGVNLLIADESSGAVAANTLTFQVATYNSGVISSCKQILSGFHTVMYVLGTNSTSDKDVLYIDGVPCGSYYANGAIAGAQSSGNLFLGASGVAPWLTSGLQGTMYLATSWSAALTATSAQKFDAYARLLATSYGVPTQPISVMQYAQTLVGDGDSLTCGTGTTGVCLGTSTPGTKSWLGVISPLLTKTFTPLNYGIPGVKLRAVLGSEPNRINQICRSQAGSVAVVQDLATNDASDNASPSNVWDQAVAEMKTLRAAGCGPIFIAPMMSRGGTCAGSVSCDSWKNSYNSLVYSQAFAVGFDGIAGHAMNPLLGADGASVTNTVACPAVGGPTQIWCTDNLHVPDYGQSLRAQAIANAINAYYGSNASSPTIVTGTGTLTAGNTYVLANIAADSTLTLPTCIGQAGRTYTIVNPSAFTVSILTAASSQPINGTDHSVTPLVITAGQTLILRDAANTPSVSGCHWDIQ